MTKHWSLPGATSFEPVFHRAIADRSSAKQEMTGRPGNNVMVPNLNAMTLQALGSSGFMVLSLS